jgi:hypothetical protein
MDTVEIRTDLPRYLPVAGHYQPAPFYLTSDMFGGVPVQLAGGPIHQLVGKPVATMHRHDVAEVYLLVSPTPGKARIEVTVEETTYQLVSPALLHVPAGAEHCFLTVDAEPGSFCFGILLGGSG